jgi:rod shape-determining protein MreD
MKYVVWVLVAAFIFILQGSISLFDITPNLTAALACYAGIKKREIKGMFLGSLIGIIEDSLSGPFLGPNLLSKGLIGYLSSFIYSRFFIWTPLLGVISISVLTLIDGFIVFMSRGIFDKTPVSIGSAAFIIIFQALLNAPLGIFLKPNEYEGLQRQVS